MRELTGLCELRSQRYCACCVRQDCISGYVPNQQFHDLIRDKFTKYVRVLVPPLLRKISFSLLLAVSLYTQDRNASDKEIVWKIDSKSDF